jgi:hypothetical protein
LRRKRYAIGPAVAPAPWSFYARCEEDASGETDEVVDGARPADGSAPRPTGDRDVTKRRPPIIVAGLAALAITAAGCSWSRNQVNQADMERRVAGVVPGQTTVAELEAMAGGPPTSITPIGDKQLYAYTYGDAKTEALTLLIINIGKTNSGFDTALFLIDENGIVEFARVGQNSRDLPWEWWAFGD